MDPHMTHPAHVFHRSPGGIDRDRKPQHARVASDNCRVHSDDPAAAVEQWSSAVAGVDLGVGLDEIAQRRAAAGDAAAKRAYHADRDRALKAIGVADRDRDLPDLEPVGVAKRSSRKAGCGDPDDREVDQWIPAEALGYEHATVGESDLQLRTLADDVVIRQNLAVRGNDYPRGQPQLLAVVIVARYGNDRGGYAFADVDDP